MQEPRYAGNSVKNENAITNVGQPHDNQTLYEPWITQEDLALSHTEATVEKAQEWLDSIELRPRQYFDPLMFWIFAAPLWTLFILLNSGLDRSPTFPWNFLYQVLLIVVGFVKTRFGLFLS